MHPLDWPLHGHRQWVHSSLICFLLPHAPSTKGRYDHLLQKAWITDVLSSKFRYFCDDPPSCHWHLVGVACTGDFFTDGDEVPVDQSTTYQRKSFLTVHILWTKTQRDFCMILKWRIIVTICFFDSSLVHKWFGDNMLHRVICTISSPPLLIFYLHTDATNTLRIFSGPQVGNRNFDS